jgi:probable phosphoglycerate mutase
VTQLILIRHGETDWNRAKRIQGNTDIPLNTVGIEQARRLALRLTSEPIDAVLSSDLLRAKQTAEALAAQIDKPMIVDTALRERGFGIFESLTADEIKQRYPLDFGRWQAREWEYVIPNGESLAQFYGRIRAAFDRLGPQYAGSTIAAVTHGGVLDCVYRLATDMPVTEPRSHPLLNAAINRLRYDLDLKRLVLVEWGDMGHLDPASAIASQRNAW